MAASGYARQAGLWVVLRTKGRLMPTQAESSVDPVGTEPGFRYRPSALDGMYWLANRYWWAMLGAVLVFYLAAFNGQWRVEPDSALYLSLARSLAAGQGYTYHGQAHELAYPGLPYLVALTFRLFGIGNLWPAHLMMLLFALAGLGLVYRLFYLHSGHATAVVMTWTIGSMHIWFRYAFQLRNDLPFAVGVVACLAGFEAIFNRNRNDSGQKDAEGDAHPSSVIVHPYWYDWLILVFGLITVVVMRPTMLVFLPVLILSAAWALRRRMSWRHGLIGLLAVLVLAGFFVLDPRRGGGGAYTTAAYEGIIPQLLQTAHHRIPENIARMLSPLLPETMLGVELEWRWLNTLAGLLFLALGLMLIRRRLLWGLWVAAAVAMMLVVHPDVRYFLPVVPVLAFGLWHGIVWMTQRTPAGWRSVVFVVAMAAWMGPNIGKNIGLILEQRQTPFLAHYRGGRFAPAIELGEAIRQNVEPESWVVAPDKLGRILTYYSDRRVIERAELAPWPAAPEAPTYVIEPLAEQERGELAEYPDLPDQLQRLGLRAGEVVSTVERPGQLPPWRLHRLEPVE
jgi:hypothetical protein